MIGGAMTIKLYINLSDNRAVNKSLTGEKDYDCNIKRETAINNPVIEIVTTDDLRGYNYVYIPLYGRYYYAKVSVGPANTYTLSCNTDVLMSFKSQFLPKEAIIKRSSSLYNLYMPDSNYYISSKMRRQTKAFSGALSQPGDNYILVTA